MNLAQKVCEHVNALPEPAVQKVLDFVEFLTNRLTRTKKDADASQTEDNGGLTSSYHSRAYPTCRLSNRAVATFCSLRRTP
jgi:hypothetical protein